MVDLSRCVVACDFTAHNLVALLRRDRDLPAAYEIVSGDVRGSLLRIEPDLTPGDLVIVWTRVATSFSRAGDSERLLTEVDELAAVVSRVAERAQAVFVPTWATELHDRGPGLTQWREAGQARALAAMNLRLATRLAGAANVFLFDTQRWLLAAGDGGDNRRGWYLGKIPYTNGVFREAADDFGAALRGLRGQARKLLVLDLDNTLWGGIVGEVGWQKLRLGGHDAVGEAFVDFQRQLAMLAGRGVVLGIVSKNDERVALEAIEQNPEMVLRLANFAGWRINWRDKAENLDELVTELNLGLDSVVFIDDHPAERGRVVEALPSVLVPDWPDDPMLYTTALARLRCFDQPTLSQEDLQRTALYVAERQRREGQAIAISSDDWLASLDIAIDVEPLTSANLTRAAQLLNKTNQMNLATRRLSEGELEGWPQAGRRAVHTFRLRDRFGDAGIIGILGVELEQKQLRVIDFVLSCRVFGRGVEQAMLYQAVHVARQLGAASITATYLATERNGPCLEFFRERSGFEADGSGASFCWNTERTFDLPSFVEFRDAATSRET